jgi:hypothetical protein
MQSRLVELGRELGVALPPSGRKRAAAERGVMVDATATTAKPKKSKAPEKPRRASNQRSLLEDDEG